MSNKNHVNNPTMTFSKEMSNVI